MSEGCESPCGSIPGLGRTVVTAYVNKDGSVNIYQRFYPSENLEAVSLSAEQWAYVKEAVGERGL